MSSSIYVLLYHTMLLYSALQELTVSGMGKGIHIGQIKFIVKDVQ